MNFENINRYGWYRTLKSNEYLFQLPNMTHLSYAFPQDLVKVGGSQFKWYHSFYDYRVVNKTPKKKDKAPRLGLWSARGNQKIICADFDNLPKGRTRWNKFFEEIKNKYPNDFVFRSQSGKVKIFFLVELKTGYINHKMANYILQKLLSPELYDAVDNSLLGMSVCYSHPVMVQGFRDWLKVNPRPRRVNLAPLFRKISNHNFKIHEGKLPKLIMQKFVKKNKSKELFVRILLRQRRMAMKSGFDIPTTKFARELGVDQKTVHRWRNELVECGFIVCSDDTYKINKKAMTYKAVGLFRQIVKNIFTAIIRGKKSGKSFYKLPEVIPDGEWQTTIWKYSKFYLNKQQEFIQWVESLPNSDQKRRVNKAYSALKSRLIYNDLEYLHLVK